MTGSGTAHATSLKFKTMLDNLNCLHKILVCYLANRHVYLSFTSNEITKFIRLLTCTMNDRSIIHATFVNSLLFQFDGSEAIDTVNEIREQNLEQFEHLFFVNRF